MINLAPARIKKSYGGLFHHPLLVITVEYATLIFLSSFARHYPISGVLLSTFGLPLGLYFYGYFHNHFHSANPSGKSRFHAAIGIVVAAPLGMSWVVYKRHHANHHKYNNGPGDYARTIDPAGNNRIGLEYIWRSAAAPALAQFVPFLSFILMKPKHRTALALVDEVYRVLIRISILVLCGVVALAVILYAQLVFLCYVFYINYLQHLDCESPSAHNWDNRWFNILTFNLGVHDDHHRHPARAAMALGQSKSPSRKSIHGLGAHSFLIFLTPFHSCRKKG